MRDLFYLLLILALVGCTPNDTRLTSATTVTGESERQEPRRKIDPLEFVAADHVVVAVLQVERLESSAFFKLAVANPNVQRLKRDFEIEWKEILDVTLLMHARDIPTVSTGMGQVSPAILIRFRKPVDQVRIVARVLGENTLLASHADTAYLVDDVPEGLGDIPRRAVCFPDATLMIVAVEGVLRQLLEDARDAEIDESLRSLREANDVVVVADFASVREPLTDFVESFKRSGNLHPLMFAFADVPKMLKHGTFTANANTPELFRFELEGYDEAAHQSLQQTANGTKSLLQLLLAQSQSRLRQELPAEQQDAVLQVTQQLINGLRITSSADRVTMTAARPEQWDRVLEMLSPVPAGN